MLLLFIIKCPYKPGLVVVKYTCMHVRVSILPVFYDFQIELWNCSEGMGIICFSFYYCIIPVRQ
jgi:hypothetical protein